MFSIFVKRVELLFFGCKPNVFPLNYEGIECSRWDLNPGHHIESEVLLARLNYRSKLMAANGFEPLQTFRRWVMIPMDLTTLPYCYLLMDSAGFAPTAFPVQGERSTIGTTSPLMPLTGFAPITICLQGKRSTVGAIRAI